MPGTGAGMMLVLAGYALLVMPRQQQLRNAVR